MNAVKTAIYDKLTGGTALMAEVAGTASVHDGVAPRGAAFGYVIFAPAGGGDENITKTRFKNLVWSIKGVSDDSAKKAGEIDAEIDALLHNDSLSVTGWGVFWLMREGDFEYSETTLEGRNVWHVGGTYRIRMYQT